MRTIEVSIDVFSRIWMAREAGEDSEDSILSRILPRKGEAFLIDAPPVVVQQSSVPKPYFDRGPRTWSQPTWATDIAEVLEKRGGKLTLRQIYDDVEKLRRANGRSLPRSLEATVRRTLENHSSDSHNYTGGADLFCMPEGKGEGVWALR